jgi:hypothetical protein
MADFHFVCDVRCHLANGDTETLRSLAVEIEAYDEDVALSYLDGIVEQTIIDGGSRFLDAPLDRCEITRFRPAESRWGY